MKETTSFRISNGLIRLIATKKKMVTEDRVKILSVALPTSVFRFTRIVHTNTRSKGVSAYFKSESLCRRLGVCD